MIAIKQIVGTITKVRDISPTAKEVEITLTAPLGFHAGAFVNVFLEDQGETVRRAYSISSNDGEQKSFNLSIRHIQSGRMSTLFWNKNMVGTTVKIMGPLGLNTVDKMQSNRVFLFGFGIGVGVIKALAEQLISRASIEKIVIMTGSRNTEEILYKDYFNQLQLNNPVVTVRYVISSDTKDTKNLRGYIQDHIDDFVFDSSDVYICGQEAACQALQEKILSKKPQRCQFFIEGFH